MNRCAAVAAVASVWVCAPAVFAQMQILQRTTYIGGQGGTWAWDGNFITHTGLAPFTNSTGGGADGGNGHGSQTSSVSPSTISWNETADAYGVYRSPNQGGSGSGNGVSRLIVDFSIAQPSDFTLSGTYQAPPYAAVPYVLLERIDQASTLYNLTDSWTPYSISGTFMPGTYRLTVQVAISAAAGAAFQGTSAGTLNVVPAPSGAVALCAAAFCAVRRRR